MAGPSIEGYESLHEIGKGGFSRVYQGQQAKFKRVVAIKVLNFGLNDEADRRSFERECELMGRVSTHPNIVTVHDTEFTSEGQPCIVMEHYPGGSLADLIGAVGELGVRETLEVGVAIAAALEASHQANVLHCDLKPQNILISEFGQPALGDFGISTFAEERTYTGTDAGAGFTLAYAAPEILEGASPSIASDVYSLAATLYTSLAGRRPFFYVNADGERPIPAEQARRILLETAPPLTDFGVPAEVDEVIAAAMAKEPEDRPATAADFAFALHQVGQSLGLGTSTPRIAEGSGLLGRTIDESVEVEPSEPAIDLTQLLTKARTEGGVLDVATAAGAVPVHNQEPVDPADHTATRLRTATPDSAAPAAPAEAPAASPATPSQVATPSVAQHFPAADGSSRVDGSRKVKAAGFAVASLVAVAALLFFVLGRDTGTEVSDTPTPVVVSSAVATDPVIAPNQPTDVSLVHLDDNRAAVLWTVPGGVDSTGDVTYEVRRQGGDDATPLVTSDSILIIDDVSATDATCVTVLSVRSNRTSAATSPVCLGPAPSALVTVSPTTCQAEACTISFAGDSALEDAEATVTVVDRFNDRVDAQVDITAGQLVFPAAVDPGLFLAIFEAENQRFGITFAAQ